MTTPDTTETELLADLRELAAATERYHAALAGAQGKGPALMRAVRRRRGLTQRALGDLLNVSHTWISKVENGALPISRRVLAQLGELIVVGGTNEAGGESGRDQAGDAYPR